LLQLVKSFWQHIIRGFSAVSFADTIKSAIRVSPLSLIRLACGFVRSKIAAVFLGVVGIGLVGEANQFLLLITTLGSLGMANSMMQQMSFYRENNDQIKLKLVNGTVLTSQTLFLLLFVLVSAVTYRSITSYFFNSHDNRFSILILIICISSPLNVLASNYVEGFFTAYQRFDLYIKASSIATILSLLFFIPAVYFWRVEGGLISIVIAEVVLFLMFLWYVIRIEKLKNVFVFKFDAHTFKLTFRDGMVNLICSFLLSFCGLLLRQMVISDTGEFNNGIYQFCLSITAYYTPFLTNLLWAKYFPLISAKRLTDDTRLLIRNTLTFIVIASSVVVIGLLIVDDFVIKVLATRDFSAAKKYLPVQFLGDFWYFIFYLYTIYLMAMRHVKRYLVIWLIYLGLQYIIAKVLVMYWGLNGIIAGYSIASLVVGVASAYFFSKLVSGSLFSLYRTMIMSFFIVAAEAIFAILGLSIIVKLALFFAWLYWVIKPFITSKLSPPITFN